jgi:steroid delta-isomerase-like uncharacterized protein
MPAANSISPKVLVERFYEDVWNNADEAAAHEILSPDFVFRGSLGTEKNGVAGFLDYTHAIHTTFRNFHCSIQELVIDDNRVAARMLFSGMHQARIYGVPPTGEIVSWAGAAFFETGGRQINKLWVLGDIDSVKSQIGVAMPPNFTT